MTPPDFIIANITSHRRELLQLNVEYVSWVLTEIETLFGMTADELVGMSASEYVLTVIDKVCGDPPPKGVFYLLRVDGQLAGMGGLRFLRTGIAEIKRIYIRPEFRGMKLGERILERLLADAKGFGYQSICIETALFMKSAHRLYERNGFTDCPAYEGVEVPEVLYDRWRFMERTV